MHMLLNLIPSWQSFPLSHVRGFWWAKWDPHGVFEYNYINGRFSYETAHIGQVHTFSENAWIDIQLIQSSWWSLPVFTDWFCSHICEKNEKTVFLELLFLWSWYIADMGLLAFCCCNRYLLHKWILKNHIFISMCACYFNSIVCFLFIYKSPSFIK